MNVTNEKTKSQCISENDKNKSFRNYSVVSMNKNQSSKRKNVKNVSNSKKPVKKTVRVMKSKSKSTKQLNASKMKVKTKIKTSQNNSISNETNISVTNRSLSSKDVSNISTSTLDPSIVSISNISQTEDINEDLENITENIPDIPITNLIKDFREAKKQDTNILDINKSQGKLSVCSSNPGGLRSKSKTVENYCFRNDIDVIAISETHYAGKSRPYLSKNYKSFHKNRTNQKASCKGGVAVFVKNELAEDAVVIDQGDENSEEFIAVKLNQFKPPVLIFCFYGPQQTVTKEAMTKIWDKVTGLWRRYEDLGWTTIAMGDFNAAIGNQGGMKNNHPSINRAGQILLDSVSDLKWTIINTLAPGDARTHVDRSSPSSSRCLDYIVSNAAKHCQEAVVDNSLAASPYTVQMSKEGPVSRKFSDHKSVLARFQLTPAPSKKIVQPPKFIRNEESRAAFAVETDTIADEGLELLAKGENVSKIVRKIDRRMKKAMFKTHQRIKPNRPATITEDEAIFWSLTESIEDEVEQLQDMKINNKIWELSKRRKLAERGDPLYAMLNHQGDLADTREEIEEVILKHNKDLLARKPHPLSYQEIFKMKKDVLDNLMATEITEFNTFTFRDYLKIVNKVYEKKKPMFDQFRDSTPRFKAFIFWILKKMYEEEEIPEEFFETSLIALFKKGDSRDPSNYRYLQVKKYLPRLLEDAIYLKVEDTFDKNTQESQAGGKKQSDCQEHLIMLIIALQKSIEAGAGICLTFVDIRKCFDRLYLSDSQWFLMRHGGDLKAIKMLTLLLSKPN